jgi:hypothetical protein
MSSLHARCQMIVGVAGLMLLSAAVAIAAPKDGPKDAEALELAKKAINNDYLGTKFADAEKKLKQALALCEPDDACSAKVRAQILCDLGIVYIGGMSAADEGKAQFVAALKQDPEAAPNADLLSPEIEAAFADAKKVSGGPSKGAPPSPKPKAPAAQAQAPSGSGDLVHAYKPFGATEWKALEMKRMTKGYGVEVPCAEVGSAPGELSYYIQAFDGDQNLVSWTGSRAAPLKVQTRLSIEGDLPHLPGQSPPARCPDVGDCPPDFPGCHGKKSDEPPPCDPDRDGAECAQPKPEAKKNWLSLAVQQDLLVFSGNTATCAGPPASDYTCFDPSGNYYGGIPYAKSGDAVRGGLGLATTRVLAGYDRAIGNFTVGAKVGFAFRGGPQAPGGRSFVPLHGEARAAYWFGSEPFARKGVRPYVVIGGGVAQVDGKLDVVIYNNANDYQSDTRTHLDAWKKAGTGFVTGGVGLLVPVTARMGPFFEFKYMQLFGASAPVLSLQLGYAFGL